MLLAFVLILLSISFFNSKFYYHKILRKPHPAELVEKESGQSDEAGEKRKGSDAVDEGSTWEKQRGKAGEEADSGGEHARGVVRAEEVGESKEVSAVAEEERSVERMSADEDTVGTVVDGGAVDTSDTMWIETEKLICGISEQGGRLVSVKTKEFRYREGERPEEEKGAGEGEYIELVPENGRGGLNLSVGGEDFDGLHFETVGSDEKRVLGEKDSLAVAFVCEGDGGLGVVKKVFEFAGDGYRVGMRVESPGLSGKAVMVGWKCGITGSEDEASGGRKMPQDQRKVHVYDGKDVRHVQRKKPGQEEMPSGLYKWMGVTSKYFLAALVHERVRDTEIEIEGFEAAAANEEKKKGSDINYGFVSTRFAEGNSERYWVYVGPGKLTELRQFDIKLEKVLFGGWRWFVRADIWFPALCELVLWLLVSLHGVVRDYGVVILLLTLLSKVVTFPLTQSSQKSMKRMGELKPKIDAIRQRYKSNPRKMQEETMALYRSEGINPLNPGCLPMVLQMPVFISLFVVLRKAIELRGAPTVLIPWVSDLSRPEALPVITPLFQGLLNSVGLEGGIPMYGNTVGLLPIVMAVLTYLQNKMTIKDPNQKAMIYFMPVFLLILFNSFPSGLVLYWTFSNALGILQQYLINRGTTAKSQQAAA